jgi:hypothetical protein
MIPLKPSRLHTSFNPKTRTDKHPPDPYDLAALVTPTEQQFGQRWPAASHVRRMQRARALYCPGRNPDGDGGVHP